MYISECKEIAINEPLEVIVANYEAKRDKIRAVVEAAAPLGLEFKRDYLTELKRDAWKDVLDKTGARRFMSTKKQEELTRTMYDKPQDLPNFNYESLTDWLEGLMKASPALLREACREAFEILTPQASYHKDYKTNADKREIPRSGKVILEWMCDTSTWNKTASVSYTGQRKLLVLDRVFSMLDSKATPDYPHDSATACKGATQRGEREAETVYFGFKMHLNGNLHVTLKRDDLVKRLIEISAGNNINKGEV